MIRSAKDLSSAQKLAVESLLGRAIAENEQISIQTIAPPDLAGQAAPGHPDDRQPESRPIWEVILDNMKDIPPDEFEKLPKDGASAHDHYLYGHPKRNQ